MIETQTFEPMTVAEYAEQILLVGKHQIISMKKAKTIQRQLLYKLRRKSKRGRQGR